jgi:DNA-binding response OmpR family regulator
MRQILIVDDDNLLRRGLGFHLEKNGFKAQGVASAEDALAIIRRDPPDLVLMDIGLTGMDGLEAMKQIHQHINLPVILLTARRRELDQVLGLELGADDYVVKPFDPDVLLARIRSVLRRATAPGFSKNEETLITVGAIQIDLAAHTVTVNGSVVELPPRAFDLLVTLAQNAGNVVTTDDIMNRVWGADFLGEPQIIYVYVRWLREKLEEDPNRPTRLLTVRGVGYKLVAA